MMREVEIGSIYVPEEIVSAVEKHKESMLKAHEGTDSFDMLQRASFSMWFGDYLYKFGYRMLDDYDI
jgi:hypothetical protein